MGYNAPDVYYQPEKFGLKPVAEIDYSSGSYEFDIRVVWVHELGKLYTARDSGCSCPSPFESHTSLESLDELQIELLEEEVRMEVHNKYHNISVLSAEEFLDKVRAVIQ